MTRKFALGGLAAGLVLLPLAVLAQTATAPLTDQTDAQSEATLMGQAKITLASASEMALKVHTGTVAGIGFNDENGRGIYEAQVLDAAGQTWIVKIDAVTGETLATGDKLLIGDLESEVADNGRSGDNKADGEQADGDSQGGGQGGDEGDEGGMTEHTNG